MRKTYLTVIVLAMFVLPVASQARPAPVSAGPDELDPAKLAVARDIIAVVLPPDQREKIMTSVLDSMLKSMLAGALQGEGVQDDMNANPKLRAVFERFIARQRELAIGDIHDAVPGLVEAYAHAYARMFSLEDLQAIKVFVQTPAGAHFVQRGPSLLADPDVADWQRRLAAKGMGRQQSEIQRFKAELLEARDSKPSKT